MTPLGLVGALCGPLLLMALVGFLIEAANAWGDVPKHPEPYTPAELKALVRREFTRSPVPDDSEQRWIAAFLEGQS